MIQKISLLLILATIGIGFYWLLIPAQQVDETDSDNSEQYRPNVASINQQVADKFLKTLTVDATDIGPDIDPQAKASSMKAKLSGAIKAITTNQNPTAKQLNSSMRPINLITRKRHNSPLFTAFFTLLSMAAKPLPLQKRPLTIK